MVNKTAVPILTPRQKTALTLLGYKRWVLRCTVGRENALSVSASITENKNPRTALSLPTRKDDTYIFPLVKSNASLWISRDYTVLYSDRLSYYWLLPSLWATEKALVLFAGEQEHKLWLSALNAVGLKIEAEIFLDIFQSEIPFQTIPDIAVSALPDNITAKKTVAMCATAVNISLLAENKYIYPILPPLLVLRQSLKKRVLWQQLLALKEKVY